MRQKYKAETCQPGIPEAPISKPGDGNRPLQLRIPEALQPGIPKAPIFELSDMVRPL